jgi:hypothetical protein
MGTLRYYNKIRFVHFAVGGPATNHEPDLAIRDNSRLETYEAPEYFHTL